jgi:hypothetical protein
VLLFLFPFSFFFYQFNKIRFLFFFFLHVRTKRKRKIQTNNLRFIRHDPNKLNYFLSTRLFLFDHKESW